MAHEIIPGIDVCLTRTKDAPAWHKIDTRHDEITAATLRAARFARPTVSTEVLAAGVAADESDIAVSGYRAIVADPGTPQAHCVSVVAEKYPVPADGYAALVNMLDPLLQAGLVRIVSAGTLRGFQRAYVACEMDAALTVAVSRGDEIKRYWINLDSLDAKHAACSMTSNIRPVCANTVASATRDGTNKRKLRHAAGWIMRREQWAEMIKAEAASLASEAEIFRAMAAKQVTEDTLNRYLREAFEMAEDAPKTPRYQFARDTFERDIAKGTLWGAYNAAQSTLQWFNRDSTGGARLNDMFFGQFAANNRRYMDLAVAAL